MWLMFSAGVFSSQVLDSLRPLPPSRASFMTSDIVTLVSLEEAVNSGNEFHFQAVAGNI